jgi:hypothetical protein
MSKLTVLPLTVAGAVLRLFPFAWYTDSVHDGLAPEAGAARPTAKHTGTANAAKPRSAMRRVVVITLGICPLPPFTELTTHTQHLRPRPHIRGESMRTNRHHREVRQPRFVCRAPIPNAMRAMRLKA